MNLSHIWIIPAALLAGGFVLSAVEDAPPPLPEHYAEVLLHVEGMT